MRRTRTRLLGPMEAAALALTAAACVALPRAPVDLGVGPPMMVATPVPLHPRDPGRTRAGELTYLAGFHLQARGTSTFHGLSGLEVTPDAHGGVAFVAVSDDGDAFAFAAVQTRAGWRMAEPYRLARLRDTSGAPLQGKPNSDAEAITFGYPPEGVTLAFERRHRLQRTRDLFDPAAPVEALVGPPELARLPTNDGVEALATLPLSGRVVLAVGAQDGRVWFCEVERASGCSLFLRRSPFPGFQLTSLDHLPGTTDMVALYRAYDPLRGMRTIVARVVSGAAGGRSGEVRELARLEGPLTHENFEGVAAVGAGPERWTLWLISDDGFPSDARTLLLAFDYAPTTASDEAAP